MSPYRERFYQANEARTILADALARTTERGLPQSEVDRLLRELRVSPSADGIHSASPKRPFLPKRIVLEETVDGELTPDQREDILELIRATRKDPGHIEVLGRTFTWTATPKQLDSHRAVTITLRARDGRTRIRIEEELQTLQGIALLGYVAFLVSSLVTFISMMHHEIVLVGAALVAIIVALAVYFGIRSAVRRYHSEHQHLLASLCREIAPQPQRIAAPVRISESIFDVAFEDEDQHALLREAHAQLR